MSAGLSFGWGHRRPPAAAAAARCARARAHTHTRTTRTHTEYRLVAKKGEGTFSEVLKAQCIRSGKFVAIKCMKNRFDSLEQVRARGVCARAVCGGASSDSM